MVGRRVELRTTNRVLWYVATVGHKQEALVQSQVRQAGFQTYLPLLFRKYSNRTVAIAPMLPGYLFVKFNVSNSKWQEIARMQGVTGLLGWKGKPAHVPTRDIRRLMSAGKVDKGVLVIKPGDLVEICDGSSSEGFRAEVTFSDAVSVQVSIMMFGKIVQHKFRLDEVRRV